MLNAFGIVGVILILIAYFLLQSEKLSSKDIRYPIVNLVGSILILLSFTVSWNLPSFIYRDLLDDNKYIWNL